MIFHVISAKKGLQKVNYERRRQDFVGLSLISLDSNSLQSADLP